MTTVYNTWEFTSIYLTLARRRQSRRRRTSGRSRAANVLNRSGFALMTKCIIIWIKIKHLAYIVHGGETAQKGVYNDSHAPPHRFAEFSNIRDWLTFTRQCSNRRNKWPLRSGIHLCDPTLGHSEVTNCVGW